MPSVLRGSTDALSIWVAEGGAVPLRVLLVDDDERFRAAARRTLVADGAQVVAEVGKGTEVERAVRAWQPDVVLLDIDLPDIDGLEVARRLRNEAAETPVILISTRDVEYGQRVSANLAAGYVRKDELSVRAIVDIIGDEHDAGPEPG
jgi:CheY-like chemotaxis protein